MRTSNGTHRRAPALLLLGGLGLACGGDRGQSGAAGDSAAAATDTPGGELAYVTNEGSGELTIIDTSNDSVVGTIPVGTRPRGIRLSEDGRTVYVALSGSPRCPPTMPDEECEKLKADKSKDGIGIIDVATRKVTKVLPGGSDPEAFDISKDGTRLFVSNEDVDSATIVDIESGKILRTVSVGREPEGVELHPSGETVWVTGETDHDVTVLDTESGKVITKVDVGERPRDIAFARDGSRAYVSGETAGTVTVVDGKSHKVLKTIRMPEGSKPMGVEVSPDQERLFVANGRGKSVSVIDLATDSVVSSVEVGVRPWGIALTGDGRKLYSANGPSNDVSVVDTESMKVIKTIPAGELPWGVAVGEAP
jgi:PQQ-dependent catabolism-associated beta-propeller protein